MSLFVNTNVSSLNATRQLFASNNNLSTALEQLLQTFELTEQKMMQQDCRFLTD
jgi:flagellin